MWICFWERYGTNKIGIYNTLQTPNPDRFQWSCLGIQRADLDDRFWGRVGYVPSGADVVLRTGLTECCLFFGCHLSMTKWAQRLNDLQKNGMESGGPCRTKQWMSDDNSKWQGKPMMFLPANEAAAAQRHCPPGLQHRTTSMWPNTWSISEFIWDGQKTDSMI